jgi:hypothetical protein
MLAIAGSSVAFALFTITVRDTAQIRCWHPARQSQDCVLHLGLLGAGTWHAGLAGHDRRAIVMALAGWLRTIERCLAGAIILFMLSQRPG